MDVCLQGYLKGYATVPMPSNLEEHIRSIRYNP